MAISQEEFYGGSEAITMSGDATLKPGMEKAAGGLAGRVRIYDPNGAERTITLPDATKMRTGGPIFYIFNADTAGLFSIDIDDADGGLVLTLQQNKACIICLADNSTVAGVWAAANFNTNKYEPDVGP